MSIPILTDVCLQGCELVCTEHKKSCLTAFTLSALVATVLGLSLALHLHSCEALSSDDSITAPITFNPTNPTNPNTKSLATLSQAIQKNTETNSHNVRSFLYIKGEMSSLSIMITALLAVSGMFGIYIALCSVLVFKKPSLQPANNIELEAV